MPKGRKRKITPETLRTRFCRNLKRLMGEREIDNAVLAEAMGLTTTEVWRYSSGLVYPSIDRFALLCATFEVEPNEFLRDPKCLAIIQTRET